MFNAGCCAKMRVILLIYLLYDILQINAYDASQLTLLVSKQGSKYKVNCINRDTARAITWTTPIKEDYIPDSRKSNQNVPFYNASLDERVSRIGETSFMGDYGLVLDQRWEGFETHLTDGITHNVKFIIAANVNLKEQFEIPMSINLKIEAHIYICSGGGNYKKPYWANCYWIILGGFSGKKSVIRKCDKYEIPTDNSSPSNSSACVVNQYVVLENPLNQDGWTHIVIKLHDNYLIVNILGKKEPFIEHYDKYNSNYAYDKIYVRSSTQMGFWKLHESKIHYFSAEQEGNLLHIDVSIIKCVSMYIFMCEYCSITLWLSGTEQKITFDNKDYNNKWQRIKFQPNINSMEGYKLVSYAMIITGVNNKTQAFWSIDQISVCSDDEINISEIKPTKIKNNIFCQYLIDDDDSDKNIKIKLPYGKSARKFNTNENKCLLNQFGKFCTNCSYVVGREYCEQTMICELNENLESSCACSPGYTNTNEYCNDYCGSGTYGDQCEHTCGNCQGTCNHITGVCVYGCKTNYKPSFCTDAILPVIKENPRLEQPCFSNCTLLINAMEYNGEQKPETFQVKYKESNDYNVQWITTNSYHISVTRISLENLKVSTLYEVKIILVTINNESHEKDNVDLEFNTSCKELYESDIIITPTNITANLVVEANTESCDINKYYANINRKTYNFKYFPIIIYDLYPYSEYNCEVRKSGNNHSLNILFHTLEGVPSEVNSLQSVHISGNNFNILWNEPTHKNGPIQIYKLYYLHRIYFSCKTESNRDGITVDVSTITTQLDLEPYSEYIIRVAACTSLYEGRWKEMYLRTNATDKPAENETKIENVEAGPDYIIINFENTCEKQQGPLLYTIVAHCSNEWCTKPSTIVNSNQFKARLSYLYPYSDYKVNVNVSRPATKSAVQLPMEMIRTAESTPIEIKNLEIYSVTATSVSLRWSQPYPPTGILEKYKITATNTYWAKTTTYIKVVDPIKCKIWKNMICYTFNSLAAGYTYEFRITAKNQNVDKFSLPSAAVSAVTNIYVPSPPLNLNVLFDEQNNLTIQWEHPYQMNGDLKYFHIHIGNKKDLYEIKEYNLTYTHKSTQCWNASSILYISINCESNNGFSQFSNIIVDTPPDIPVFKGYPEVLEETNTSISVRMPKVINIDPNQSNLFLIISSNQIEDPKNASIINNQNEELINITGIDDYVLLVVPYDLKLLNKETTLVIGNKSDTTPLLDIILLSGTKYNINFVLMNTNKAKTTRRSIYKIEGVTGGTKRLPMATNTGNPALYALLLLLLVPLLVYVIMRKKGVKLVVRTKNRHAHIPLTKNPKNRISIDSTSTQLVECKFSKPVMISDFQKYVKESFVNGELERQHNLFPRGMILPSTYGMLPQNKSKNRYNNLVAYDHTRVHLDKINDDPYSDYINANYLMGVDVDKCYIATQGPKVATVNDFWRMVWQEKCINIIMVANVVENGKKKTEQYWPNINEENNYGGIKVKFVSSEIYADYEFRNFNAVKNNEERNISQLHFTSWPDHGIPLYPQSLVPFLRKMLKVAKPPMVIHCSAGVGRTGTITLIDLCLRMAAKTGYVDVLHHINKLREQRPNMVDNIEQYKLVHLVLLECLIAPDTAIKCDETFENIMNRVIDNDIEKQMDFVANASWQDDSIMLGASQNKPNPIMYPEKNRFADIVPTHYGEIIMSRYPPNDESSTYINAIHVDGFNAQKRFIATQNPLPNTIADFWRLVYQKETTVIVSLNEINSSDAKSCEFWPNEKVSELIPVPIVYLKYVDKIESDDFDLITIKLIYNKEIRDITIISVKSWLHNATIHDEVKLLSIWCEMNRLTRSEFPIVVTCRDGSNACGLYIGMCFVLEKIKLEQVCDVCLATRVIRRSRKQFIKSADQFMWLYRIAYLYLSEFETYSNFTSK